MKKENIYLILKSTALFVMYFTTLAILGFIMSFFPIRHVPNRDVFTTLFVITSFIFSLFNVFYFADLCIVEKNKKLKKVDNKVLIAFVILLIAIDLITYYHSIRLVFVLIYFFLFSLMMILPFGSIILKKHSRSDVIFKHTVLFFLFIFITFI